MGEAAENWAEERTDWGWGATGGWTVSSKLKKAFEGRLPYMGMDVLAKSFSRSCLRSRNLWKKFEITQVMRGDVTMYSTRPLIGCDLARFGEGGRGKKLGRKRQVHTIIIICNTQCHLQWQCLRKKLIISNYLDGSSHQLSKINPYKHWDLKAYAGCSCLFPIRIFCWVITMMMNHQWWCWSVVVQSSLASFLQAHQVADGCWWEQSWSWEWLRRDVVERGAG